jgi:hypothetical protein
MADEIDLREEDRLPWLETVEPDMPDGPGAGRVIAAVLLGLVVLAGIIFGIYKLQQGARGPDGQMIAAQEGDYKIKPNDPGGLKVKGEGDAAIATSAGKGAGNGAIDLGAVPEAPVAAKHPAAVATVSATGSTSTTAKVPGRGSKLVAAPPLAASRSGETTPAASGSLVQLGAYPTEGAANTAWAEFSRRFGYLAQLGKSVQPVATGGRTLYRLRVNAGSANQAADICGRLRVAGESCFVAS